MARDINNESHQIEISAQVMLYHFYFSLIVTHVEVILSTEFAYKVKEKLEGFDSKNDKQHWLYNFYYDLKDINKHFASYVNRADRLIWKSDPEIHVKHETYEEISRFNQVFFAMEDTFREDTKCWSGC